MGRRIEFYEQLREHIPDAAARMIAEEMPTESQVATKDDVVDVRGDVKQAVHDLEISIERLRSSMFRWQLTFFIPLWAGVYATLVAIVLRGT